MFITPAFAQAASAASAAPSGIAEMLNFVPLALILLVFYFLFIRPQQRQVKTHKQKINAVKKGDQVVTGGGLVGKVTRVDENYVDVDLGQGQKVKAVKSTLSDVIDPKTVKPAND